MNFRYWKSSSVIISVILVMLIVPIINILIDNVLGSSLSTIALAGMLLGIIDQFCIKCPFLNKIIFSTPNLNGRYKGHIYYLHPITNIEESKQCFLEVIQTGSQVKINSYFEKKPNESKSYSISEEINKKPDGGFQLIFTYQNDGSSDYPIHNGTNVLDIIIDKRKIKFSGLYYTNKIQQTKGTMVLDFVSKKTKGEY